MGAREEQGALALNPLWNIKTLISVPYPGFFNVYGVKALTAEWC